MIFYTPYKERAAGYQELMSDKFTNIWDTNTVDIL